MKKRLIAFLGILFVLLWIAIIFFNQKNSSASALSVTEGVASPTASNDLITPLSAQPTQETYIPLVSTNGATPVPVIKATPTPTSTPLATATSRPVSSPTPPPPSAPTAVQTAPATTSPIFDSFEGGASTWKVSIDLSGSGSVVQNSAFFNDLSHSALASTAGSGSKAQLWTAFNEPASAHLWGERPGTWFWQRTSLYIPSATIQQLGAGEYMTIAGLSPSSGGSYGWWLRIKQAGALYVYGFDANGAAAEFPVYGSFPADQWVELSLGLHTQNGPGVKRAFSFLINGNFYGWYHQGHMDSETYNRAAFGILDVTSSKPVQVYLDSWRVATDKPFPDGPDNRPINSLQEQDFRTQNGIQWQIDWSTWMNNLWQAPEVGLYSASDRLQSGRNLDRMPNLTSGWAEIEIDWPNGTPPAAPNGYFGPMVGFRKEINREENLEVIPIGRGGGAVDLVLEAWVNGGPLQLATWPMPADASGAMHLPAPGDIIRVRWQQINANQLAIVASFFDASQNVWNPNIINVTINPADVGGINFNDGNHLASSITIDSPNYSIRRFKVGTIDTAP